MLDGQAKSVRGANFDFLACGRLFTYFAKADQYGVNQGHYHYFAAFTPFALAFPAFAPPFTTPIGAHARMQGDFSQPGLGVGWRSLIR